MIYLTFKIINYKLYPHISKQFTTKFILTIRFLSKPFHEMIILSEMSLFKKSILMNRFDK